MIGISIGANPGFVLLIDGHVFELLAVFDFALVGVQPTYSSTSSGICQRFD